tara:strand:- start:2694 stop:3257 length:564 start_codon:yes stop_codon:yes gene_type:complete
MTRDELLDKYRYAEVEHDDWWEGDYEALRGRADSLGIEVEEITFTGFYSQGDGAAFSGRAVEPFSILNKADYPLLSKYIDERGYYECSWRLAPRGNFTYDVDFNLQESFMDILDVDHPFADIWDEEIFYEVDEAQRAVQNVVDELEYQLYSDLRSTYEYLTSDEVVWECIVANQWDEELDETSEEEQ